MPMDRFFIAPYDKNSGLQRDYKPFLIPEEAFSELNNAYVFRGRVRKRFGSLWMGNGTSQLLTRLRVLIDTTDAIGDVATTTPLNAALAVIVTPAIGQMFSIGDQVFTVNALGNPAAMLISGTATLATFDTTTGAVIITGADPLTDVYYYPALPVMGFIIDEQASINNEKTIAFDTRFAYQYVNGWERIDGETSADAAFWTGNNSQFFWGTSWRGTNAFEYVLFVTNFNELEARNMRRLFNNNWNTFRPQISAALGGIFLDCARIIVTFKDRLVVFNTWENEGGTRRHYPWRARWSQVGSPLDANAFRQDIPGRGSAVDASTDEAIVTVEFIKDRLIVYFERSTYEFVYTQNQMLPFVWQKINTELGAESTFSIVPFDKVAIGIGNVGIHACNGSNVERIDNSIPDEVFKIHNTDDGPARVYGIRDYYVEMVYWTFPNPNASSGFPFPNRILTYNYKTATWAFNDDSITAFGYFQSTNGITWSSAILWDSEITWGSAVQQPLFRNVIAGNQEGYTFIVNADIPDNTPALQITDITIAVAGSNVITITSINHNFTDGDYVYLQDIVGTGNLNLLNNKIFQVMVDLTQSNEFTFIYTDFPEIPVPSIIAGTYEGNGVIARVSQIDITTKEFNFYLKQGRNTYVSKVDFHVTRTFAGQIQADYYVSTNIDGMIDESDPVTGTGSILGTNTLETFAYPTVTFEAEAERLWHPVYFQGDGEFVQFRLFLNDAQMRTPNIKLADFELHAMCIHAQPTSSRLQ